MKKKTPSFLANVSVGRSLIYAQWGIPVILAVSAMAAELLEHKIEGEISFETFDTLFFIEMLTFGFLGPLIVGVIIVYLRRLVDEELRLAHELKTLNQELEERVARRTAELEQSNCELSQANIELTKLDKLKSEFVSLVSHELRAPLTTLNGGLEVAMQSAGTLPPKSREILKIMARESTRLTNFVQTILDVSRLDAGKLDITLGPVAVRPHMEQAASVVLASTQRETNWNIAPGLPPALADEIYLEQVIRNLIRNADKYSAPEYPIHICASVQENQIRIGIKDHGPGILLEHQEYIFDRFTRLRNDESAPSGWGLGLYLSKKLISAQGGTIEITSPIWDDAKNPGTEFYLLLPIAHIPEGHL
ncbi:MAG: ATP-binding protein [Anaerolineales bacterium]|nr:ATP-binding protein [Anaerolineales bacterium]